MKFTPWFPGHIKPVRDGLYEITFIGERSEDEPLYSLWKNGQWQSNSTKKAEARKSHTPSFFAFLMADKLRWRGIAK